MNRTSNRYAAILHLSRPESKKYGRMTRLNRAKQFAPFAAVKGHTEALRAKERIVVPRIELSEDAREQLDWEFSQVKKNDMLTIVYYDGEGYVKVTGRVGKIDLFARTMQVVEKKIRLADIFDLSIEGRGEREIDLG